MQLVTANEYFSFFKSTLLTQFSEVEIEAMFWQYSEIKLGFSRLDYMKCPDMIVSPFELSEFNTDLKALLNQKPIQYVTGRAFFMDLLLQVSPSVLIPRPETEELVLAVKDCLNYVESPEIIDVCTGSGCIAVALKYLLPSATINGLDISKEALELARLNAVENNLAVNFKQGNALQLNAVHNTYDAIVSNPPYVLESEKQEMKTNVLAYEPHLALFVDDEDPLLFYHAIGKWAKEALKTGGWLFFEINQKYGAQIVAFLTYLGYKNATIKNDIFDQPRMVIAQK